MAKRSTNKAREDRIANEIVVDAYGASERAMGWYYYLEGQMHFPFTAKCIRARPISPLHVGDDVELTGMAPEDECGHEMFVMMRWEKKGLAVPLAQIKGGIEADDQTRQAIEDWHYWVKQGYEF
jgi:hypothetical protein